MTRQSDIEEVRRLLYNRLKDRFCFRSRDVIMIPAYEKKNGKYLISLYDHYVK